MTAEEGEDAALLGDGHPARGGACRSTPRAPSPPGGARGELRGPARFRDVVAVLLVEPLAALILEVPRPVRVELVEQQRRGGPTPCSSEAAAAAAAALEQEAEEDGKAETTSRTARRGRS